MTPQRELELLRYLGLGVSDFESIRLSPNVAEAKARLEAIKAKAKQGFKKAARELHPDLNNGDAGKTEDFKALAPLVEKIEQLQLRVRRPAPVYIQFHMGFSGGTVTTSSTSTNGWNGPTGWQSIRVG